jgi:hypothetical protein
MHSDCTKVRNRTNTVTKNGRTAIITALDTGYQVLFGRDSWTYSQLHVAQAQADRLVA